MQTRVHITEALLPLVEFAEFWVRQADIGFQFQSLDLPLKQVD